VWSAVNHLEEADAATKLILQRWRGSIRYTAPTRAEDLMQKRSYILCLLAACYKYLGEDKLTEQALDEAEAAVSNYPSFQHPLNLYDWLVRDYTVGKYSINVRDYRRALKALPAGELPK
jgi:hypothetical protein